MRVHSRRWINQAVVLPDCDIGRGRRLSKVGVAALGARRFHRTENSLVLATKDMLDRF